MRSSDGLVNIKCSHCGKKFLKYYVYVRENKTLGHGSYCSSDCQFAHRKTGAWLICDNELCKKSFYKIRNQVSEHNYCSRSCAAIINKNRACPKMHRRTGSLYCSLECSRSFAYKERFTYTKDEIILAIKKATKELGRTPAKRELKYISDKCANMFGSWNAAISAAGLDPHRSHDHRMYHRTRTKAKDGHECDSVSEAIIDDWLTKHGISHERNGKFPDTNHRADWVVLGDVFIEYFGLASDSPRYDRAIKEKQKICRRYGIKLLEIYPSDLYPKESLNQKLGFLVKAEKSLRKTVKEIKRAHKKFRAGKGRVLHSLSDL